MLSPGAVARILTVPLFACITHELVGLVERKRLAAMKNPNAALLLQRRAAVCRPQGYTLAFGLEGKGVSGFKAQLVPDLLGNNNAASFVDSDCRTHNTIIKWSNAIVKWQQPSPSAVSAKAGRAVCLSLPCPLPRPQF